MIYGKVKRLEDPEQQKQLDDQRRVAFQAYVFDGSTMVPSKKMKVFVKNPYEDFRIFDEGTKVLVHNCQDDWLILAVDS